MTRDTPTLDHRGTIGRRAASRVALIGLCVPLFASCVNDGITSSRSSTNLIIERIGAAPGGSNLDPMNTYLQSDVLTFGGVFEDIARVTLRLSLKDPGTSENPASPTTANFVTIRRYHIRYVRGDGRNTPGVDVPYPWWGGVTTTALSGIQTAEFTLVRASSKLEPPLRELVGGGGQIVINTIAEITFYGTDQTGAEVSALGTIGVNFADWADPMQ